MKRFSARALPFLLSLLLLPFLLILPLAAQEEESDPTDTLPTEYPEWLETLPEELLEQLPEGVLTTDPEELGEAVEEMSSFSYLLRSVLSTVGLELGSCLSLFGTICGILLLSAVCRSIGESVLSGGIRNAFSLCASLVILLILLERGYSTLSGVAEYFQTLHSMTAASVPLLGVLYSMGGNVSAAVASSGGLTIYMAILEQAIGGTVLPFCGICLGLSLMQAAAPELRLGGLCGTLKKNYTTVLAFLMMLLLSMLAAQTALGTAKDTLAMKSAKFATGNLIPVVGGAVSELLRSVTAGVQYLRGSVGICAILLLLFLLLPTVIRLLLFRMTWQLSASVAELLGCDNEKKLLDEFCSLCGFLIAAAAICSSVVFLSFVLLVQSGCALG